MATFEPPLARRRVVAIILGTLVAVCVVAILFIRSRPPQMGADGEVFTSVDALFTAVTAHDEKLLNQCDQRLHALRDAGKLPPNAWAYLDGVIKKSRAGRWQSAAETLYDFMMAQRRDGAGDHALQKKSHGKSP